MVRSSLALVAVVLATTLATARPFLLSELSPWLAVPLILLFAIFASYGLTHVFEIGLGESLWFRKYVFRRNYIEGYWWDTLEIEAEKVVAILCIEHHDEVFHVQGWQYRANRDLQGTWISEIARFDGRTLKYFYNVHYFKLSLFSEAHGVSEMTFIRSNVASAPCGYTGEYNDFHPSSQPRRTFRGNRMTDDEADKFASRDVHALQVLLDRWLALT